MYLVNNTNTRLYRVALAGPDRDLGGDHRRVPAGWPTGPTTRSTACSTAATTATVELAVLDPATGVRTDQALAGLPVSTLGYGGAWFDAARAACSCILNDGHDLRGRRSLPGRL